MARRFEDYVELANRKKVGYTLSKRDDFYVVRFPGPTGDYMRLSTGMREKREARHEAEKIISMKYCQTGLRITWDELSARLKSVMTANGNREQTGDGYVQTILAIRRALPDTKGPLDIDVEKAQMFKERYLTETYKRGKGENAKTYQHKKRSFYHHLQTARTIWKKWLKELMVTTDNPWAHVSYPKMDKNRPYVPDEEVFREFFQFVKTKYANWGLPLVFLQAKALLGCRLLDLCSLPSRSLNNGVIDFDPDQLKGRDYRRVELPKALYEALDALKGDTYLWDRFPQQKCEYLTASRKRYDRPRPFSVRTLYNFIQDLFNCFQEKTGKPINSHSFRRRAITILYLKGVRVEIAAKLVGMDVRTAWRYYLDLDKIDTKGMLASMEAILIPKV